MKVILHTITKIVRYTSFHQELRQKMFFVFEGLRQIIYEWIKSLLQSMKNQLT
jgi:hypothetical protein